MKHWMLIILAIVAAGCSVKNNDGSFAGSGKLENVEDGYMMHYENIWQKQFLYSFFFSTNV